MSMIMSAIMVMIIPLHLGDSVDLVEFWWAREQWQAQEQLTAYAPQWPHVNPTVVPWPVGKKKTHVIALNYLLWWWYWWWYHILVAHQHFRWSVKSRLYVRVHSVCFETSRTKIDQLDVGRCQTAMKNAISTTRWWWWYFDDGNGMMCDGDGDGCIVILLQQYVFRLEIAVYYIGFSQHWQCIQYLNGEHPDQVRG